MYCHSTCYLDAGILARTAFREGLFEQPLAERPLSVRRGKQGILFLVLFIVLRMQYGTRSDRTFNRLAECRIAGA